jgi:small subunit ribosomal protein S4e
MGSIGEKHLSRLASPKKWNVKKKGIKWIARPLPGAHSIKDGIHLLSIFRDMLNYANTLKEVRKILSNQDIYVDGKRRKDPRFIVGLMDVIFIPKNKESFRLLLTKKGKLTLIPIDEKESNIKLCKITGKTAVKKKIQINLFDGKNILADKADYKVGDTLLIEVPSLKIKDSFALEKGNYVYLTGGKYVGETGTLQEIGDKTLVIKKQKELIKTSKNHAFVIGKTKAAIKIEK